MKGANFNTHPETKGCDLIKTVVRWSWKSSFSKECVITHLPNKIALKIDGAQVYYTYLLKLTSLVQLSFSFFEVFSKK
jgi:hypothetical protein